MVEDILRVYGYNNVEFSDEVHSSLSNKDMVDFADDLQEFISNQLTSVGYHEIMNNSLTPAAYYAECATYPEANCVHIMNPLSSDLNVMRQTLLFGGLESIARNANRKNADLKFFEFGNCYYFHNENRREAAPAQPTVVEGISKPDAKAILSPYSEDYHLGLWVTGKKIQNSWAHADQASSVYELKGYVENIFARLGIQRQAMVVGNLKNDVFSAALTFHTRGGKLLATVGIVTKKLLRPFDIENEVFFADLNWKELMKAIRNHTVSYVELSKYPAVKRDLALLLDKNIPFADVERIAFETERRLLKEVSLFDVYEGKNLKAGKKSYAVSFILQDENQTLNDKLIEKTMERLVAAYEQKLGAKLR